MVLLGDNKTCKILGTGSIPLQLSSGQKTSITKVRHVPELKRNLISFGMLDRQGYSINATNGKMKVSRGSDLAERYGIYILEGNTAISTVNVAEMDEITLWHKRLGHMSEKGLLEPDKQKLLDIKKINELKFCENCTLGKSERIKFSQAMHTTKENLNYIHADMWGLQD